MKKLMKYICVLAVTAIATIVIMYNMANAEGEEEQVQPPTMSASNVSTNSDTATINVSFGGDIKGVTAGAIRVSAPDGITCSEGNSKLINETSEITSCTFTFTGFSSYSESTADITFTIGGGGSEWSYISKSDSLSKQVQIELTATATVTIEKQEEDNDFTLSFYETSVNVGDSVNLPEISLQIPVTWTSSDESVVKKEGDQFFAIGEGNATLTATAEGYNPQTLRVSVTRVDQPVDDFSLSFTEATIKVGESRDLPEISPQTPVTWESSDENVVKIEGNQFKAMGEGKATLTATAGNISKTLVVNVNPGENPGEDPGDEPAPPVDNDPPTIAPSGTIKMYVGDVARYGANKDVTWSSSDNSIVIINESTGQVTAIGEGKVTITATAKNGKKATAQIVVERQSSGNEAANPIISPSTDFTINAGDTYQLSADMEVEWISSDESVATVDTNGLVKGVGGGNAFIYAKSKASRISAIGVTVKGTTAKKGTGTTTTNKTGNAVIGNGNTSSTVNEEVPSTGEASTGTLVLLGVITLIVAAVIFRKRIK